MLADNRELLDAWFHILLVRLCLSLSFVLGKILRYSVYSLIVNYGLFFLFLIGSLVDYSSNLVGFTTKNSINISLLDDSWSLCACFSFPYDSLFSFPHLYSSWIRYRFDISSHVDFKCSFLWLSTFLEFYPCFLQPQKTALPCMF